MASGSMRRVVISVNISSAVAKRSPYDIGEVLEKLSMLITTREVEIRAT
jgi:hypothetical protein